MKPPPFRYHDPATLDEALDLVATLDNAKLLAGGQSADADAQPAARVSR